MNWQRLFYSFYSITLFSFQTFGQPTNNNCDQAIELCPNVLTSVTTADANITVCPGCEDDFAFCFTPQNTVWLSFTTNSTGGNVSIDFSNFQFETTSGQDNSLNAAILLPIVPCSAPTYSLVGNCVSDATGPFILSAIALAPLTTYYVVISGDMNGVNITQPAECLLDVMLTGSGVERPQPIMQVTQNETTLCEGSSFIANVSIANCPDSTQYKWYINGELVAITADTVFQSTNIQTGDVVSVSTTCYSACPITLSSSFPPLTVTSFSIDAGTNQYTNAGVAVQLNGSTTGASYFWSPSFGVSDTLSLTPFVQPDQTTTYSLTASLNGCVLQDQVTVFVKDTLLIPTTFSPNADGINDYFEIKGIEEYPNCFLTIYNRWGQEIFQSTGYSKQKSWDGKTKNGELNEGVYFYILDLRDAKNEQRKGSITVIK